jgi:hypothetical protein
LRFALRSSPDFLGEIIDVRFLLHDEPHTLGYPGRGRFFVRAGRKKVIDRSFIMEEKMAGCWRIIDF